MLPHIKYACPRPNCDFRRTSNYKPVCPTHGCHCVTVEKKRRDVEQAIKKRSNELIEDLEWLLAHHWNGVGG